MNQFDDSPEAVIAYGERSNRQELIPGLVLMVPGGIVLLISVGVLLHLIDGDIKTLLIFGGFLCVMGLIFMAPYQETRKKMQQLKAQPDPASSGYYQYLRKRWQVARRTSSQRQWKDTLRSTIPIYLATVIWLVVYFALLWLGVVVLDLSYSMQQTVGFLGASVAAGYVISRSYSDYAFGLHRRGKARGIQVIASDTRPFAPVLKHIRKRISKGPVWLVIEPPAFQLSTNYMTHQIDWEDADHVIVMDGVDFMQSGPHLTAPEFVALIHHPDIRHIAGMDAVITYLAEHVQTGDVVVILSIGDEVTIADTLLAPQPDA